MLYYTFIIYNELLDNQQLFSHCKSRKILAEASAEAAVACRCRRCCWCSALNSFSLGSARLGSCRIYVWALKSMQLYLCFCGLLLYLCSFHTLAHIEGHPWRRVRCMCTTFRSMSSGSECLSFLFALSPVDTFPLPLAMRLPQPAACFASSYCLHAYIFSSPSAYC